MKTPDGKCIGSISTTMSIEIKIQGDNGDNGV